MNAVILAGGFGSRLRPLTDALPKPMLTVSNLPIIDYAVSHLTSFGVGEIFFSLSFCPEDIIEHCAGYKCGKNHFFVEPEPLGTLGGIKAMERGLDDCFLVVSGDAIENVDFGALLKRHSESGADVTMAVSEAGDPSLYGVVEVDGDGFVTGFKEKPKTAETVSRLVNTGVYAVSKSVLTALPKNTKLDFALDLFPLLADQKNKRRLGTFFHQGYWRDVGDFNSYYASNFELMDGGFFDPAPHIRRDEFISLRPGGDTDSLISVFASVDGGIRRSVVGKNAYVGRGAVIENCVVLNGTQLYSGEYRDCIISGFNIIPVDIGRICVPGRLFKDGPGLFFTRS
jgi:NDP-sugar pyrophosphorylase family protein